MPRTDSPASPSDSQGSRTDPPPEWLWRLGTAVGTTAIVIGLLLVGLILYAVLT